MKIVAKYIVVAWFSILLFIGNTPMDFIHLFADHEDTIHHDNKGLVIEKKHHHCAYLSLTLESFINDYQLPFIAFVVSPHFYTCDAAIVVHYMQRSIVSVSLRGPPVA